MSRIGIFPKNIFTLPTGTWRGAQITNHHQSENQSHNEISITPVFRKVIMKKKKTSVSKDVEKIEHLCTIGKNLCMENRSFPKKLKIELPCNPAIPLLSIYLKKMKTPIQKDKCTLMFIATIFMIAQTWMQPVFTDG